MADNVTLPAATGKAASDEVTYSGDATAQVQLVRIVSVTGAEGSKTVQEVVDGSGLEVQGSVAHDAVDAGTPIKLGHRAIAHGTNPTAVAAADRTDWYANRAGVPFVMGGHPNIQTVELATTGADSNVAIITIATGLKIVVTAIQVTADNANTVFPSVRIGFGTASTPTTTGVVASHPGVPAGGGFSRGDGSGIIGIGADNEDLRWTISAAPTGGSVRVVVTYFTVES